jgi:hypothetical protein
VLSTLDAPGVRVHLSNATLHTQVVELNDTVALSLERALQSAPMLIPYKKCVLKQFTASGQETSLQISNLFASTQPQVIIVCMNDNDSSVGHFKKNPYSFKHYNLQEVNLVAGNRIHKIGKLDFTAGKEVYSNAYMSIYNALGIHAKPESHIINFTNYIKGHFITCFDTSRLCDGLTLQQQTPLEGNVRLELVFKEAPGKSITINVLAFSDSVIKIDKERNVSLVEV